MDRYVYDVINQNSVVCLRSSLRSHVSLPMFHFGLHSIFCLSPLCNLVWQNAIHDIFYSSAVDSKLKSKSNIRDWLPFLSSDSDLVGAINRHLLYCSFRLKGSYFHLTWMSGIERGEGPIIPSRPAKGSQFLRWMDTYLATRKSNESYAWSS